MKLPLLENGILLGKPKDLIIFMFFSWTFGQYANEYFYYSNQSLGEVKNTL
jgi:hypothetical protein